VVPIGERALLWVAKYEEEVRPRLVRDAGEMSLFLTQWGERFSKSGISYLVSEYIKLANLGKTGSCHLLRHSMATAMLEGGADIRYIQALLGHARLTSTEIYTHVSISKLKAVHLATHPAATLERKERPPEPEAERVLAAMEELRRALDEDGA
jgi:integrase/recombinase XerD